MRTLVYKRTHKGDPDRNGRFGIPFNPGSAEAAGGDADAGRKSRAIEFEPHASTRASSLERVPVHQELP
jgi:hypothetical protein